MTIIYLQGIYFLFKLIQETPPDINMIQNYTIEENMIIKFQSMPCNYLLETL